MADEGDKLLLDLRAGVEKRIREQLARHTRVSPNVDYNAVVEIQMGQETERLERIYEKFDDEGQDAPADFVRGLIDDWLHELGNKLMGRG